MRDHDQQRPHLSRAQQNGGTRLTPFRPDSGKFNSPASPSHSRFRRACPEGSTTGQLPANSAETPFKTSESLDRATRS